MAFATSSREAVKMPECFSLVSLKTPIFGVITAMTERRIEHCNLFEKMGVKRKTVFTPECNVGQIQQYNFGFGADALHHIAGEGGHMQNNKKILKNFEDKGKLYYNYKCS